ncbi:type IV secretion system protein [Knoellia aerolata]|uniref:TrbL/VirB6 plasmid conjugal transfer protein n=1 Tax=Knoellia aerolata DSM 18566 TaxID=1385519 RepID=A0A0A0JXH8_9MICO|nr:type IV secretion system protein [Knoellia aerolata]KGN41883.1 hypothetical protein N801_04155 [Knoellia aerolata DSM 18566]
MFNPFEYLASAAGKVVADGWTAVCLGVWNAGLWLLKLVLTIVDSFTTPDLSETGPGAEIYKITFWIALTLMITLSLAQLGISAFRRDGRSVGQLLIGTGQFLMVWAAWLGYGVALLAAVGGLTKALMNKLLHIDKWAQFEPLGTQISVHDISDGTVATVLMVLAIFLVFAAIGHLLVMLARAGSLLVLAATTPIAAAGLSSDFGRDWFWKSFRWFHAAAFTPVLMILVLGIGVQMTSGVATGMTNELEKAIGTAVPGVVLICIGCFSPLALFKLLAFTDPGTTSGAALRTGLSAQGGISGLLGGLGGGSASDSNSAASATDENGKSQGESAGEDSTSSRFNGSTAGMMGKFGGALGQAGAAGIGAMEKIGSTGASVGADLTNQMGVGHNNYVPDFTSTKRSGGGRPKGGDGNNPQIGGSGSPDQDLHPAATGTDGAPTPSLPTPPTPSLPSAPGGGGPSPGGGGAGLPSPGGGGAGAEGAGAGAGAAGAGAGAIPVVPV